jgi:tetratricopeptide (TPR) repeat protein
MGFVFAAAGCDRHALYFLAQASDLGTQLFFCLLLFHRSLAGVAFGQKGQMDEAITQFRKAVEINPNFYEAHYVLGAALGQKAQLDEAISQFQEVLRLKPDYTAAQAYLEKARALVRQRDGHK